MKTITTSTIPLLLVDGNNLLYRAAYGFPAKIYNRNRNDITTLFAFFALLRIAFKEVGYPLSPIVCFDGEHALDQRRLDVESYKANRINNTLNPYADLPLIIESLLHLQIPVLLDESLEADDLIADLVLRKTKRFTYIMSSDKDFYQLLSERTFILNTMKKSGERVITSGYVVERFGVSPSQWVYFRALMGDPSDFIMGVSRVGPKTAQLLVQLTAEELAMVLRDKYQTSWLDFQRMVSVIELKKLSERNDVVIKEKVLEDFLAPAKLLEKLGLWG